MNISRLQQERYRYRPVLPRLLEGESFETIRAAEGAKTEPARDKDKLKELFPRTYGAPLVHFEKGTNAGTPEAFRVGVILSGGPAAGGHNVIAGLFDGLRKYAESQKVSSLLLGFQGGPSGLLDDKHKELDAETIDRYRNTGGFDMIGSGRTKIETPEQFARALSVARKHELNALVVIGGDDSNTNAALLAEYFAEKQSGIRVIGCPKTIDGDLKNSYIEASFGFDTAAKVYSELIGNIARDALSSLKYWHFIRVMGRSASHIALECALQTRPNVTFISEEVAAEKRSLKDLVQEIVRSVVKRAEKGLNYGLVLIPEGVIEFIPEIGRLIAELNNLLSREAEAFSALENFEDRRNRLAKKLENYEVFAVLPESIQAQLLAERDPHGNVQVSLIETEKLLAGLVREELAALKEKGEYRGKFGSLTHFFGYEGRCAFPSNFDADYGYALGLTAFLLIRAGKTGYIAGVSGLEKERSEWTVRGIPAVMLMNLEERHGSMKPVIQKALVELEGAPFKYFASRRDRWAEENAYLFPGPLQFFGDSGLKDRPSETLLREKGKNPEAR